MKDRGVVCVFSVFKFNAGGSVCGCMCVNTHTHTHTHCTDEVPGCEPRGRDETPGGPKESRWTKSLHIHMIRVCVQVHMCMYLLGGGMRSWTKCFFLQHNFQALASQVCAFPGP